MELSAFVRESYLGWQSYNGDWPWCREKENRTVVRFTGDSLLSHTLEPLCKGRVVFSSKEKEMILDSKYAWIKLQP